MAGVFAISVAGTVLAAAPSTSPVPQVLTPPSAPSPRINGPTVFGVRPGSPLLYSIPATGNRPMKFSADRLPDGVTLDVDTGRMTGKLALVGTYPVTLHATNNVGSTDKAFRIIVGNEIALTPAMGWNSYNCFGERVTQELALKAAHQFVQYGLDQHGWTYINMDDGWQSQERDRITHAIRADPKKFTDVKAMVAEIHGLGLKAGIYSSPWTTTYGGRLGGSSESADGNWSAANEGKAAKNAKKLPFAIGKYRFTEIDAHQYADWGFDYLKYDWGPVEMPETKEMQDALRATGRDLVFSLSNNHVKNLFPIIGDVSPFAESWRTTTDIRDVWSRIGNDIGFAQDKWAPYAKPGHFNDADMLVIGQIGGWGGPKQVHACKLTPDEQYTHISLWCLITSPLLIGTDLADVDPFTLGLLTNDEVLDVDQDALGKQGVQVGGTGDAKVYAKPMEDGSLAVGMFNVGKSSAEITVDWTDLKIAGVQRVRDLWRQQDLGNFDRQFKATVAPHGVVFVRLFSQTRKPS